MWLFRQTGLRQQELATGSKLRSAIEEARNLSLGRRSHDLQLLNADPRWLNAVSPKARIRWGELVCEEFSNHFHLGPNKPEPDQRVFLVTLCDRRCCTSHQEKNIDIPAFIRILRRGLRGLRHDRTGILRQHVPMDACAWEADGFVARPSARLG
jgi:hypothetical protein